MPPPASLHSAIFAPLQRWLNHRLEHFLSSFPLRHASLSEGLRAACGAGTMLLLGEGLHNPLFSWAAIGAFLTCLADSAGSNRARLASMGGFAIASTIAGLFAATLSKMGLAPGLLAIMACAGVAGFARIYGAATGLVLMLAAGVSAILADFPVALWPLHQSHLLVYFAGCAWATLLGLTVWRIHPFAPARNAVARVYDTLAELARLAAQESSHHLRDESTAATRRHARTDIANARNALMRIAADRADTRHLYENLLIKLARADSLLNCITALSDLRLTSYQHSHMLKRSGRVLEGMELLLREIGNGLATRDADSNADDARSILRLRQLVGRMPAQAAQLLQLPELAASTADSQSAEHQTLLADWKRSARASRPAPGLRQAWRDLLSNTLAHVLSGSAELQHGLRCAVAAGTTYLLVHLLALPFGYWATMATMLVMQPSIADSWTRSMERAVGSIVGAILAVLLCLFIHSPWLLALLVFPLSALAMGLRPVSYGLYSTFLTPVFVLVADVASDPQQQLGNALLRAGNNVIGTLIAIAASYLLWPRRQPANLHHSLSQMIAANLDYLRAALRAGAPTQLHARRRSACVSNNENGLLLQRLLREQGMDERQIQKARICVALSRRLAATATHIWLHPAPSHDSDQVLQRWLERMEALFSRSITINAAYPLLLQQRPAVHDLARADAVETLCLLMQAMYPELAAAPD
jgi:uncharacterized membrane protein YccC